MIGEVIVSGFYIERAHFHKEVRDNEEMFRRLQVATTDKEKDSIVNEILKNNVRSIHDILRRVFRGAVQAVCWKYRMTYDEIFALGYEFLLDCIRTFDVNLGFKFTTYYYRALIRNYNKYFDRIKIDPKALSLDKRIGKGGEGSLFGRTEKLADTIDDPIDIVETIDTKNYISSLLDTLAKEFNSRNMDIFRDHIAGVTQANMSEKYGLKQGGISKIVRKMQARARQIRNEWAV